MLEASEPKTVIYLTKHDLVQSFSFGVRTFDWKSDTQCSKHCWAVSKKYLDWAWKSMKLPTAGAPWLSILLFNYNINHYH
jgi:hypothetical protein